MPKSASSPMHNSLTVSPIVKEASPGAVYIRMIRRRNPTSIYSFRNRVSMRKTGFL